MEDEIRNPTFCSEILRPGHVIHSLQRLGLLPRESLFIVIFARSADPIEEDATRLGVSKEVDNKEY